MSHGLIGPITLKGWETSREIAIPAARPAAPGKGLLRYLLFLHFERQGPGLLQPSYQITVSVYIFGLLHFLQRGFSEAWVPRLCQHLATLLFDLFCFVLICL